MLRNKYKFIRIQHRASELLHGFLLDELFAVRQFFVCRRPLETQLPGA